MNKSQWLNRFEDELDCAYMDTTKEQYSNKDDFINDKWEDFKTNQAELAVLNYEDRY